MRAQLRPLVVAFTSLSISACSGQQLVNFSLIEQSNQCGIQTAKIELLASETERAQFIKKYGLFKSPDTVHELTQSFEHHSENERVFIVAQGTKPSAGYGFTIHGGQAQLHNNRLTLPISFTAPAKDAFLAQVVTSPCLVIGVDASASYHSIHIDALELNLAE